MKYTFAIVFFFFSILLQSQERGKASFYANRFHMKKTASGIPFHKDSLFCAHRKYPFGTVLRVKNLKNDKEILVKVVDRGPFVKGRVVDLSRAAADSLGFVKAGVAKVQVWVVEEDSVTRD